MATPSTLLFDLNTLPFSQAYNTDQMSFGSNQENSSFGLNRMKYNTPSMSYSPSQQFRSDNSKAATMDFKPTESDVLKPQGFNVQDGTQAVYEIAKNTAPGDGGQRDAMHQQVTQQVTQNLNMIATAKDPDAVAASIMSQPEYGTGSLGGALMGIGLAAMSGRKPDEILQAGMKGSKYFADEDRKARMSDYLRQNTKDLLDAGYSPNSISAAISSGDNSLLQMKQLSPQEKREQELADREAENKEWERRTGIEQSNRMDVLNTKSADQRSLEAMKAEDKADAAADKAAAAKQDAESQVFSSLPKGRSGNNSQMTALTKRYDKNITNWRMADQAYNSLQGLENADSRTQLATMQAEGDRLARSLLGGNATLTPEQIKEITGSPMTMDQFGDWLTTNTDQGRAKRAIDYMSKVAKASRDGYSYTIRNDISKDRENMKRYNNGDPHKTTQDIMTVAGVDPEMFMRPDELDEFSKSGRWIKKGGIHEKYGVDASKGAVNASRQSSGSSLLDAALGE